MRLGCFVLFCISIRIETQYERGIDLRLHIFQVLIKIQDISYQLPFPLTLVLNSVLCSLVTPGQ